MTDAPSALEPIEVAVRVRAARKQARLTQAQLAHAVGAHPITVTNWETGKHVPSLGHLAEIARATGRPLAWFLQHGGGDGGA